MGTYGLGRTVRCCVSLEAAAAYDTIVKPVNTDSCRILTPSFTGDQERIPRNDKRQTPDVVEEIQRRDIADITIETYVNPLGTTNPPDIDNLLRSAFRGAPSVATYNLLGGHEIVSCDVWVESESIVNETVTGFGVDTMTLSIGGTEEPKLSFAGPCSRHIMTATGTTAGAGGTGTVIDLTAGHTRRFEVGSLVSVGADTNLLITAVDHANDQITVDTSITWASGEDVVPYTPYDEAQTGGSPVTVRDGSINIGGVTDILLVSANVTLANNIQKRDQIAFSSRTTDLIYGNRDVNGELVLFGRKEDFITAMTGIAFNTASVNPPGAPGLEFVLGTSTAKLTVTHATPSFNRPKIEWPEAEVGQITAPYRALASADGQNDSIVMAWV